MLGHAKNRSVKEYQKSRIEKEGVVKRKQEQIGSSSKEKEDVYREKE